MIFAQLRDKKCLKPNGIDWIHDNEIKRIVDGFGQLMKEKPRVLRGAITESMLEQLEARARTKGSNPGSWFSVWHLEPDCGTER